MFITGLVSLREEGWRGDLDPPVAPRAQASCVSYGEDVFGAGAACKAHSRAKSYSCCSLVLFSTAVPVYSWRSFSFIEIAKLGQGGGGLWRATMAVTSLPPQLLSCQLPPPLSYLFSFMVIAMIGSEIYCQYHCCHRHSYPNNTCNWIQ